MANLSLLYRAFWGLFEITPEKRKTSFEVKKVTHKDS